MKPLLVIAIYLRVVSPTNDGQIIFGEDEDDVPFVPPPSETGLSDKVVLEVRQWFFRTGEQPNLGRGSRCKDGKFASGICLTLRECPALMQIALNNRNPEYTLLQYSICGWFFGSQHFCCETQPPRQSPFSSPLVNQRSSTAKPLFNVPTTAATSKSKSACETSSDLNFQICGTSKSLGDRVVGGKTAVKGSSPWIVLLLRNSVGFCGASLITNQHVLSAAHCFSNFKNGIVARLAEHDTSTSTDGKHFDVGVKTITIHEDYNEASFSNDIAVLKLERKLCFSSRVLPICVPNTTWNLKAIEPYRTIVAGWGLTDSLGEPSTVLQQAELRVYRTGECRANYSRTLAERIYKAIDEKVICAGRADGRQDACRGDSGGPLVLNEKGKYYLIGVVSRGPRYCGTPGLPGLYARVSMYYNWIRKEIL